ncbi:TnsA-like heteromeric transposase endonuclease subunit [Streptomyces gilvosporeus]|uniref:TnsA-like heteromeric transposase endonuclease subunit n=1 Tax=Streptomyces gilvosporeus TaxID=553510 RepID=UPI0033E29B27
MGSKGAAGGRSRQGKADAGAGWEAVFVDPVGQVVQQRWADAALAVAFENLEPVSAFPVVPGRRWGPGRWWSATTGRHVACGSAAMRAQRAATVLEAACAQVGWNYRRLEPLAKTLSVNLKWLAGYRHPRNAGRPHLAAAVREVFAQPRPLIEGAEAVGDPIEVLPAIFHALWHGHLTTPLDVPLHERVLVRSGAGEGHRSSTSTRSLTSSSASASEHLATDGAGDAASRTDGRHRGGAR